MNEDALLRTSTAPLDGPGADETPVQAIMSRDVLCVTPDLSLDALTALLVETGYSGVPVVDSEGVPVGMVSSSDVVLACHDPAPDPETTVRHRDRPLEEPGRTAIDVDTRTVGDVMMSLAFSLTEHVTVGAVAAMMVCEGVHRVPIVDDDGRVVGIVSSLDVVRWVAQSSNYLPADPGSDAYR